MSTAAATQRATGPTTPAGKAKMHLNPLRHGLTAKNLILPGESLEAFEALHQDFLDHFEPATAVEKALVAKLAEAEWRLTRARRVETATLHHFVAQIVESDSVDTDQALALAFLRHGKEIERLRRYETTIARAQKRDRQELETLLKARYRLEMLDGPSEEEETPEDGNDDQAVPAEQQSGSVSQNEADSFFVPAPLTAACTDALQLFSAN